MKKYVLLIFLFVISAPFFGQTNLALNKPVTYSSQQSGNEAYKAFDDNTIDSRWAAQYFPQWIQVDLQQVYSINKTEIFPYANRAYQYKIEVSIDGGHFVPVVDRLNNTTSAAMLTDQFQAINARYVRITFTGVYDAPLASCSSIYELRIYMDYMGESIIYRSDFENSGVLDGNWTQHNCAITDSYHYTGLYSVKLTASSRLQLDCSSVGWKDIVLEYALLSRSCANTDYLLLDCFTGTTWAYFDFKQGNTPWIVETFSFPGNAVVNNPKFALAFDPLLYSGNCEACIGPVKIKGRWLTDYEAESGHINGPAQIASDPAYSNGQYVGALGMAGPQPGAVDLDVGVPSSGEYILTTFFCSDMPKDFYMDINRQKVFKLQSCNSGGPGKISSKEVLIPLKAGNNTIRYYNPNGPCPNLDKINLRPAASFFPYTLSLEAENATPAGNIDLTGDAALIKCSNEKMAYEFSGADKALLFNAFVKHSGTYILSLYYIAPNTRSLFLQVNNNPAFEITHLNSGGMDAIAKQDIKVNLLNGNNVLKFYNPNSLTPALDRITVSEPQEGESGVLTGTAFVDNNPQFSGTGCIRYLGNGSTLTLKTQAPVTGYYTLSVYYMSAEPRSFFIRVNNDNPLELKYCNSGGWSTEDNKEIEVFLKEGDNTLVFFNNSGWCPDFDMLTMRYNEAQDMRKVYGKHIILNLESADYQLFTGNNLQRFVDHLDTAYEYFSDLVGGTPYQNQPIEIRSYDGIGDNFIPGNPILWNQSNLMFDVLSYINPDDDWSYGLLNAISYDFNLGYMDDGSCGWNFDDQFWSKFKTYDVVELANGRVYAPNRLYRCCIEFVGSSLKILYYSYSFDSYLRTIHNLQSYKSDGLVYCFIRIRDLVGWEPFRKTFRQFLNNKENPQGKLAKFNRFLELLNQNSPREITVEDLFFPGELQFIRNALSNSPSINADERN